MDLRNSFIFFSSYYDAISKLPPEEQGAIYKAIIEYAIAKIAPTNLTPIGNACFILIKPTIDGGLARYDASVENGKKGGAPKGNQNARKDTAQTELSTKQPKINLETTQNNLKQPNNNLETSQEQPRNNLNIDMDIDKDIDIDEDMDFKLVNKIKNNKFNQDHACVCARVDERTEQERKPYLAFYRDFFDWQFGDTKWKQAGYEIVDTMIEAAECARTYGLKFNHKTYNVDEFAHIVMKVDTEQFRAIVTQAVLNEEINNRPYYLLGCIFKAAADKRNRMTQEQMDEFIKNLEVNK